MTATMSEFSALLAKHAGAIRTKISQSFNDPNITRVWVDDTCDQLKRHFKTNRPTLGHLDTVRGWVEKEFNNFYRVEGDPSYAGFFITRR